MSGEVVEVEGEDLLVRLDKTADITEFCRGCGLGHSAEDCRDIGNNEPLTVPVYMNTSNKHCYKEETAMGWIEAVQNAEHPRRATDPHNRRYWTLPQELKDRIPNGQFFYIDRILDLYHRGKPQMAGDMYFRTRTLVTGYNVDLIVRLYRNGMKHEAVDLHDFTYRRTRDVYDMANIAHLFSAGLTDQAHRIHCFTSHCLGRMHRDIREAMMMKYVEIGMKWFAIDVHDRTLQYVTAYDAENIACIIRRFQYHMEEQAVELHDHTVDLAEAYDKIGILALANTGMVTQAIGLHDYTIDAVESYDEEGIISLANVGMVEQAVELHDETIHSAHPMDVTDDFLKQVEIWRNSYQS